MSQFKLASHRVVKTEFNGGLSKDSPSSFPVHIDGGILIPRDSNDNDIVSVKLDFTLGSKNDGFFLGMETISTFNILDLSSHISATEVGNYCIPIALKNLRSTIKNVTTAFGISPVDLPPFSEESDLTIE